MAGRSHGRDVDGLAAFRLQANPDCASSLSTLIETEIIPRMMIAHVNDPPAAIAKTTDAAITRADVEALAPLTLQVEADALLDHIDTILARGIAVDTVMVDLLAPTARMLGEYWEDDRCDFIDVTMGLWRLQEIVHEIAGRLPYDRVLAAGGHRALFASMPGDQHSFGTVVIDEVFRGDGWVTERISEAETSDLLKRASEDWFDIIGLTISCDCHIANLSSVIAALRNVSKNPQICVMVGGRVFSADPDLAKQVGADGTARDAKIALKVAGELVRARETVNCI
jgi:methanogenic corrinoid protein MtbC1